MTGDPAGRFPPVDLETATALQRQAAREMESGPRKAVIGPFVPLLHAPELARRIQKVGEYLRFESSLPKDVLECAILTVAHRWKCRFEWKVHAELALGAGVPADVLGGVQADVSPETFALPYREVIAFCRRALDTGEVGDEAFAGMRAAYGDQGVLELLTVCGYYSTLAMILNTARIED